MVIKDLASEFDKVRQAYYLHAQFKGTNKTLDTLHTLFKVTEDLFRHLIVDLASVKMESRPSEERRR